jgi:hypothetical protein
MNVAYLLINVKRIATITKTLGLCVKDVLMSSRNPVVVVSYAATWARHAKRVLKPTLFT